VSDSRQDTARLLVVDDEEPIMILLSDFLTECGHQVDGAGTGADALVLIEKNLSTVALPMRGP
jgi:DNA-binding response OmpR family regulator